MGFRETVTWIKSLSSHPVSEWPIPREACRFAAPHNGHRDHWRPASDDNHGYAGRPAYPAHAR
jgi:hypothetical protein